MIPVVTSSYLLLRLQVPEIISTLRQAGKSSARSDDITIVSTKTSSGGGDRSETSHSSLSVPTTTMAPSLVVSPTAFAKKFEVLFCGRVSVAHKKAPPALIDECIEKFSQLHGSGTGDKGGSRGLGGGLRRVLTMPPNGLGSGAVGNGAAGSPTTGKRPVLFKRDPSFPCLQALDENGLSPEISHTNTTDAHAHSAGVQPTSLQENRTMLFTVIYMTEHARTDNSKYARSTLLPFCVLLYLIVTILYNNYLRRNQTETFFLEGNCCKSINRFITINLSPFIFICGLHRGVKSNQHATLMLPWQLE